MTQAKNHTLWLLPHTKARLETLANELNLGLAALLRHTLSYTQKHKVTPWRMNKQPRIKDRVKVSFEMDEAQTLMLLKEAEHHGVSLHFLLYEHVWWAHTREKDLMAWVKIQRQMRHLELPHEVFERLMTLAKEEGMSPQALVRSLLEDHVKASMSEEGDHTRQV